MDQVVVTIGLDIAKSVFQVHGVDAEGGVVIRQRLTRVRMLAFFARKAPCLVGMEACGSAHHWARELSRLGHQVRLIPPSYVKPYVKRQKNDMADAEAFCEAVTRRSWFASAPSCRMPSADTCPSSVLSPLSGATGCRR
jgi:transposase